MLLVISYGVVFLVVAHSTRDEFEISNQVSRSFKQARKQLALKGSSQGNRWNCPLMQVVEAGIYMRLLDDDIR